MTNARLRPVPNHEFGTRAPVNAQRILVVQLAAPTARSSLVPMPAFKWWNVPARHGPDRVSPDLGCRMRATQPAELTLRTLPVSSGEGFVRVWGDEAMPGRLISPAPVTAMLIKLQKPTRCQNTIPAMKPPPAHSVGVRAGQPLGQPPDPPLDAPRIMWRV